MPFRENGSNEEVRVRVPVKRKCHVDLRGGEEKRNVRHYGNKSDIVW